MPRIGCSDVIKAVNITRGAYARIAARLSSSLSWIYVTNCRPYTVENILIAVQKRLSPLGKPRYFLAKMPVRRLTRFYTGS